VDVLSLYLGFSRIELKYKIIDSIMHKFTSNIPLIVNNISTMQDVSAQNMDLSGSLDVKSKYYDWG